MRVQVQQIKANAKKLKRMFAKFFSWKALSPRIFTQKQDLNAKTSQRVFSIKTTTTTTTDVSFPDNFFVAWHRSRFPFQICHKIHSNLSIRQASASETGNVAPIFQPIWIKNLIFGALSSTSSLLFLFLSDNSFISSFFEAILFSQVCYY